MHNKWFNTPAFFLLLPLFFVLHGMNEQKGFVPLRDGALLLLVYVIAAIVLFVICRFFFRNNIKAAMGSFLLMAFHFFFGSMHDALKSSFGDAFITRYSVLLSVFLIAFVLAFIWIKTTKSSLQRASTYLNALFLVLIILDGIGLMRPVKEHAPVASAISPCDTCQKPDIYLLLLDEYAGYRSLKELFGFDNSQFENQLEEKGFHVIKNTQSNYNYTPFSMASLLNMDYLQLHNTDRKKPDLSYALRMIHDNSVQQLLQDYGYTFYNYSGFDIAQQPTLLQETFMPTRTRLITDQTFLSRLERDLGYLWVKIKAPAAASDYRELRNNGKLYTLTWTLAEQPQQHPKFVYTHLNLPHYPYFYDRYSRAMDPKRILPEANNSNKQDYIEYLQYANTIVLQLADHILQSSKKPPVILIMSDHGFRHFKEPVPMWAYFMNLNAIYLPNKNYQAFYDGISNVNQFRTLFNSLFNTKYPVLKDSTIYLKD